MRYIFFILQLLVDDVHCFHRCAIRGSFISLILVIISTVSFLRNGTSRSITHFPFSLRVTSNRGFTYRSSRPVTVIVCFVTGHFVVVAIDFGTTFSGYAFSFTRDPTSIHMMRKWEGGDPGVINQKTPTCLLCDPDGKFHSFGFTARSVAL